MAWRKAAREANAAADTAGGMAAFGFGFSVVFLFVGGIVGCLAVCPGMEGVFLPAESGEFWLRKP